MTETTETATRVILFVADQGMKKSPWQQWPMSTGFQQLIFGERSLTKVAGIYSTAQGAEDARARVLRGGNWADSQVVLLTPADARTSRRGIMARKMEPESRGIGRTILRAHLFTAVVGLAVGAAAWCLLLYMGNQLIGSSPGLSFVALAFFGTVFGLMLGGLISLRPDHARLITVVRSALRSGQWAAMVHPFDEKQAEEAVELLRAGSQQVERTL